MESRQHNRYDEIRHENPNRANNITLSILAVQTEYKRKGFKLSRRLTEKFNENVCVGQRITLAKAELTQLNMRILSNQQNQNKTRALANELKSLEKQRITVSGKITRLEKKFQKFTLVERANINREQRQVQQAVE